MCVSRQYQTGIASVDLNGVFVSADRGVNSSKVVSLLVQAGTKITGTVPHNNTTKIQAFHSHPSTSAVNAATSVIPTSSNASNLKSSRSLTLDNGAGGHHFSEHGFKSSYWVKQTFANGKIAHLLAMRQGHGKSVYLVTSDPSLGPGKYVLESSGVQAQSYSCFYDINGKKTQHTNEILTNTTSRERFKDGRKVRFVTQRQADALWFLLRMFSFTSTVTRRVLLAMRRVNIDNDVPSDISLNIGKFVNILHLGEAFPKEPALSFSDYDAMTLACLKSPATVCCKSWWLLHY